MSDATLRLLLAPGFGPGTLFRFASAEVPGTGVDAASEALSTEDAGGASSMADDAGEEGTSSFLGGESAPDSFFLLLAPATLFLFFLSFASETGENFFRRLDDSLRTTSSLGVPALLERPLARDVEVAAGMVSADNVDERRLVMVVSVKICNLFFPSLRFITLVGRSVDLRGRRSIWPGSKGSEVAVSNLNEDKLKT